MIAIKSSAVYEDRISIYLKQSNLSCYGIKCRFVEVPQGGDEKLAYWVFDLNSIKQTNIVLKELKELVSIVGVCDLHFSYAYSDKEYYSGHTKGAGSIPWFKV